jgi:FAD:protein FMN transferase
MNQNKKLSRRQFLQIIAVSGAAGLVYKSGKAVISSDEIVSDTRLLMGTVVNLTIVGANKKSASYSIASSFDRMAFLENILSRFKSESQLSLLNRNKELKGADPALLYLVKNALDLSLLSKGAFDITVKPLLDLYQANSPLPTAEQVKQALTFVDYQKIDIDENSLSFQNPNMSITLDGIAKGYIVDQGVAILEDSGFSTIMVEAGGDLMALGEKAPQIPWKIGLQAPRSENGTTMTTINLNNQAIATSGDYMQSFTSDYSHHHIVDPRTGYSSTELSSVSVLAPNVMLADALATTLMVMDAKAGISLIERLSNCEAILISKSLKMNRTSGFPKN